MQRWEYLLLYGIGDMVTSINDGHPEDIPGMIVIKEARVPLYEALTQYGLERWEVAAGFPMAGSKGEELVPFTIILKRSIP